MPSEQGERVLVDLINNNGRIGSHELDRLGMDEGLVRRVLDDLVGADLVREQTRPSDGRGRPFGPITWELTRTGERRAADLRRGDTPLP